MTKVGVNDVNQFDQNEARELVKKLSVSTDVKVGNQALQKILEESASANIEEKSIMRAYDRMYHTHNRS